MEGHTKTHTSLNRKGLFIYASTVFLHLFFSRFCLVTTVFSLTLLIHFCLVQVKMKV